MTRRWRKAFRPVRRLPRWRFGIYRRLAQFLGAQPQGAGILNARFQRLAMHCLQSVGLPSPHSASFVSDLTGLPGVTVSAIPGTRR
jgi:hypothetical protein